MAIVICGNSGVDQFILMDNSLSGLMMKHNSTLGEHANRAVLNECLYETETVQIWGSSSDFDPFRASACPADLKALASVKKDSKGNFDFSSTYNARRTITALSAGALDGFCSGVSVQQMLERAEYAKKPLGTRVGKLLKEQHIQWINDPETLALINKCVDLRNFLNNAHRLSYAWVPICPDYADLWHSAFYKMYLERDYIILHTIDSAVTFMIHDPTLQAYRSDAFSTLKGWSLGKQDMTTALSQGDWLSNMDRLVIDYLDKQHNVKFHPRQLFF